eukprot:999546-Rhodomonas_salina.3
MGSESLAVSPDVSHLNRVKDKSSDSVRAQGPGTLQGAAADVGTQRHRSLVGKVSLIAGEEQE